MSFNPQNLLFYCTVNDIDHLETLPSFIACTSDAILLEKDVYDIFVDFESKIVYKGRKHRVKIRRKDRKRFDKLKIKMNAADPTPKRRIFPLKPTGVRPSWSTLFKNLGEQEEEKLVEQQPTRTEDFNDRLVAYFEQMNDRLYNRLVKPSLIQRLLLDDFEHQLALKLSLDHPVSCCCCLI
jgi:hypothetical protein